MRGAVEMSACGTFETIDRAMSPFLKPVKSGRFYVAALEAGRAESSRGSGLLACRRRASDLQQTGIHFCRNMRLQKACPQNCDSNCDPYARCARSQLRLGGGYDSALWVYPGL